MVGNDPYFLSRWLRIDALWAFWCYLLKIRSLPLTLSITSYNAPRDQFTHKSLIIEKERLRWGSGSRSRGAGSIANSGGLPQQDGFSRNSPADDYWPGNGEWPRSSNCNRSGGIADCLWLVLRLCLRGANTFLRTTTGRRIDRDFTVEYWQTFQGRQHWDLADRDRAA